MRILLAIVLATAVASKSQGATVMELVRAFKKVQTSSGLLVMQSPDELAGWRAIAASQGFNCPVPKAIYDEGDGPLGITWRLECTSANSSASWKLRVLWREGQGGALLGAW